jgi:ubiquinone/menaquinone biosynthesis C-methylase UbiE
MATLKNIATQLDYAKLIVKNTLSKQQLDRTPEPIAAINDQATIEDYLEVEKTKLILNYMLVLDTVYKIMGNSVGSIAMELCCGPGVFSQYLTEILNFKKVIGYDISEQMISMAQNNALNNGLEKKLEFVVQDILKTETIPANTIDTAFFMHGAHHMTDIQDVKKILEESDRIVKPEGAVFLIDLARLSSKAITNRYVSLVGNDYRKEYPNFYQSFKDSMFAAWSIKELKTTIPSSSSRIWCHLVPRDLPFVQIIVGLPQNRKELFIHKQGLPGELLRANVPTPFLNEWLMMKMAFSFPKISTYTPFAKAATKKDLTIESHGIHSNNLF